VENWFPNMHNPYSPFKPDLQPRGVAARAINRIIGGAPFVCQRHLRGQPGTREQRGECLRYTGIGPRHEHTPATPACAQAGDGRGGTGRPGRRCVPEVASPERPEADPELSLLFEKPNNPGKPQSRHSQAATGSAQPVLGDLTKGR